MGTVVLGTIELSDLCLCPDPCPACCAVAACCAGGLPTTLYVTFVDIPGSNCVFGGTSYAMTYDPLLDLDGMGTYALGGWSTGSFTTSCGDENEVHFGCPVVLGVLTPSIFYRQPCGFGTNDYSGATAIVLNCTPFNVTGNASNDGIVIGGPCNCCPQGPPNVYTWIFHITE